MQAAQDRLDEFGNEAATTGATTSFLGEKLEQVGDELSGIAARSAIATGGLTAISAGSTAASSSLSRLGLSISVSVLPALAALATVALPLAAALGGIATVLASIAGVAALGTISALAVNFERLKESAMAVREAIIQAIRPVAEVFTPVIEDILQLLPGVIRNLIPARQELSTFANSMEAFARAAFTALPPLFDLGIELANRFLPILTQIVRGSGQGFADFLRGLVGFIEPVVTALRPLITALANNSDEFVTFGLTVLQVVVPPLTFLVQVLGDIAGAINSLPSIVSGFVAALTVLAPVVAGIVSLIGVSGLVGALSTIGSVLVGTVIPLLTSGLLTVLSAIGTVATSFVLPALGAIASVLSGPIILAIGILVAAVAGLAVAWETNFINIRTAVSTVLDGIAALFTGDFKKALNKFEQAWKSIFRGIVQLLQDLGLAQPIASGLATVLETLLRFGTRLRVTTIQIGNTIFNALATAFEALGGVVSMIFEGIVSTVVNAMNTVISTVNTAIQEANNTVPGFQQETFAQVQQPDFSGEIGSIDRRTTARSRIAAEQDIPVNIDVSAEVTKEGNVNLNIRDISRQEARKEVNSVGNRAARLQNRGSGS